MDAGVLQLRVFPHQRAAHQLRILPAGERIVPTLTAAAPVQRFEAVSLIIPTYYNRQLKNCSLRYSLSGIERSKTIQEVVFVSADPVDGDTAGIAALLGDKRFVKVGCEPDLRARARNVGAAAASCDMLLFLDDDMVVHDWAVIDVVVSRILTEGYDCALFPRRNYVRFPLLYNASTLEQAIGRWRANGTELAGSLVYDPVRDGCPYTTMAFCFPGCFMLIGRQAYDSIGGFPDEFEGWGFEDSDFALRATLLLKVLNLFCRSEPLLHIDHPVSPYKSEEYSKNLHRFLSAHAMRDVDRLCQEVIAGNDFLGEPGRNIDSAAHLDPFRCTMEMRSLPLANDEGSRKEVARVYDRIVEMRLEKGLDPVPHHIVLHGSRGAETSTPESDFDVLFLFRGGVLREFFVCRTKQGHRMDLEFSDRAKFEDIAAEPVFHPLFGPLELAKLAQGRLLYGDANDWNEWVDQQIQVAVKYGGTYWLLYLLGMSLEPEKAGALCKRFRIALRALFVRADASRHRTVIDHLNNFQPETIGGFLRCELDRQFDRWRDDLTQARRLFAFQVPEVWSALRWLADNEHAP